MPTVLLGRDEHGALVATVMVGHDGHRGWVDYVAVDPSTRGKRYGRAIMKAAEEWLRQRGILEAHACGCGPITPRCRRSTSSSAMTSSRVRSTRSGSTAAR